MVEQLQPCPALGWRRNEREITARIGCWLDMDRINARLIGFHAGVFMALLRAKVHQIGFFSIPVR
jgi:hypothetical protein